MGQAASCGVTCGLSGFLLVLLLFLATRVPAVPGSSPGCDAERALDPEAAVPASAADSPAVSLRPEFEGPVGIPLLFVASQIRKERLLDHRIRRQILEEVDRHPGIHHRGLLRSLGLTNGTLAYHLRQLERAGYLHSARAHGRKLLWVRDDEVDEEILLMTARDREVLASLEEVQTAKLAELGARCGLKASGVGYHVDRLRDLGKVEVRREGHALVLSLVLPNGGTHKVCTTNQVPT